MRNAMKNVSNSALSNPRHDREAVEAAVAVVDHTGPFDDEARADAFRVLQASIDAMAKKEPYNEFLAGGMGWGEADLERFYDQYPPLWWYDHAFDRVLESFLSTEVKGPVPAVWYVYNMGVIVKTRECAFSIDLCHRKAPLFAPHLDFALITHNHGDHYTGPYFAALARAGKPICSNFYLSLDNYSRAEVSEKRYGDVLVRRTAADHNVHLPLAVTCYECLIGDEKQPYTIFHSGDACASGQLAPSVAHPDLFLGHCAVGLNIVEAYKTTMPAKTLYPIHHQELGHLGGPWRCVSFYDEPLHIVADLRQLGAKAAVAAWGDRLA